MKKTFLIIATVLTGTFISCEKEQYVSETEAAAHISNIQSQREGNLCNEEEDMFERQLQWFSATTSKVLHIHPAARTEVLNHLSGLTNTTISAETLLENNGQVQSAFEAAFEQEFIAYLNPGDPGTDNSRPTPPPTDPGIGPQTAQEIYNDFKDILLLDNCVELYFPDGLNLAGSFTTTSTSHPLTIADCNEGILRVYDDGSITEKSRTTSLTSFVTVDDLYTEGNLIVARPIRNPAALPSSNPNCDYTQYNGIVFTAFLD